VVVGGDGSVNEVVNGIAGRGAELAVIPTGTGRDFVRTHGIPQEVDQALAIAREGQPKSIDLGLASYRAWSGETANSYFANVASAGMSGAIARRANDTTKALGGKASYVWATFTEFARWNPAEFDVSVDGETRKGVMHDVIVALGRYLAGGMMIAPDASPDDGRFDVILIGDLSKRDLVFTLPKTYRGAHLPHPKAELLQGARVSVEGESGVPIQLDGEQPGTTPALFEIVPGAVRLRVPD
jgi:YegS/Rv2252/BmrU family lipid kinase